jgi:hypothetical protein
MKAKCDSIWKMNKTKTWTTKSMKSSQHIRQRKFQSNQVDFNFKWDNVG